MVQQIVELLIYIQAKALHRYLVEKILVSFSWKIKIKKTSYR